MVSNARIHAVAGLLLIGPAACSGGGGGGDTDTTAGASTDGSTGSPGTTGPAPTTGEPTTGTVDTTTTTGEQPTTTNVGTDDTGPANTTSNSTDDSTTSGTTGAPDPVGSAGCGMADPPGGSLTMEVQGQQGQYIVSLPPGYDPNVPYPLGFAFHGRNRTGPNCQDGDCAGFQDVMESEAILVYMTSLGGTGWEGDGEREINVEFFEKVLDQVSASACVDEGRIFAAGTSSGAHFVNILGCRFGDRLLAIAPVAGYLPEKENCVDKVAALVIHGFKDPHVPLTAGEEAREFWRARNGCSDQTVPGIPEVHAAVEGEPESHACAEYQGCEAGVPVVWCEHSEGGYDDSTHGWPLFGGQQIWEFVQSL
jgi:polyhydroxybutyrate depolymerase